MDIKVFLNGLLVFVALDLKKTEATIPGITLSMTDDGNQDGKTTATCTLNMDDLQISSSTRGDNAAEGIPGLEGPPGPKGYMGEAGPVGPKGFPGPKGSGYAGNMIGEPGIQGFSRKGPTGDTGSCGCISSENFGTKESPATVTCKSAPPGVLSGTYYLGPPTQPFKVFCNMETKETCIRKDPNVTHHGSLSFRRGKAWLSSRISDVSKNILFYNNLSTEQITWLQMRSTTARQRLSYACNVIPGIDMDFDLTSAVLLLTWNDMVIGSNQTSEFPFSYSVPFDFDECLQRSSKLYSPGFRSRPDSFTSVIELKTTKVNRLPITDMWLEDIGDLEECVDIENLELCFR